MIHFNLGSHDGRMLDELTSLVEQVCDSTSTEVSTERCAFTSSAAASTRDVETDCASPQLRQTQAYGSQATVSNQSDPQIHLPVAASPESERVLLASAPTQSQPLSETFTPKILTAEELKQAEDAFYFDLRSDFDEMYGREEVEEEV